MKPFCVHSSMAIISLRENELIPLLNILLLEFVRMCVYVYVRMLVALPIAAMRRSMQ